MNILVFLKQVDDVKIPLGYDESTGTVKRDWNVAMLNPEDRAAMERALELKARFPETRITLVHFGPRAGEHLVRDGLALGCDEGLRVWDDDLDDLHVQGKALIFARVARILAFDLLFVGAKSRDTADSQLGTLLASALRLPCMSRVISLGIEGEGTVVATRRLAEGYQERVESAMPLVMTMEPSEERGRYATLPALLTASEREIPCLSLSDIGIPLHMVREAESRLFVGRPRFPVSRLKSIPAPDSSLPAFERREKLREGSMKKRAGLIVKGDADEVAEELFQTLLREGWLDHLRKALV